VRWAIYCIRQISLAFSNFDWPLKASISETRTRLPKFNPARSVRIEHRCVEHSMSNCRSTRGDLFMAAEPPIDRATIKESIATFLASKNVPPSQAWLNNNLSSFSNASYNAPVVAQHKTALFRMLTTDLTTSVQAAESNLLPNSISDPQIKERKLTGPITVQVLEIEDIGRSRWSQVEALEAHERGETTKGKEIIRIVLDEDGQATTREAVSREKSVGPHKLLLQDAKGTKLYGFEMTPVKGMDLQQLSIGAKVVLRNVVVARGLALLEPKCVEILGGKVEVWDKKSKAELKETLKKKAGITENVT
jgi:RecQ-mediated genome instability protein 1